jgi:DNA-binding response OmpR family regulator
MARILMIDDDVKLADLLKQYLLGFGMNLTSSALPSDGLKRLKEANFDLVILDLMMPEMDGFEVCKRIRTFSDVPILMLTARGETMDKVLGLEFGVDDYLAKPFDSRELVARIKAIVRRSQKDFVRNRIQAGPLLLEVQGRKALLDGQDLHLSTHEFELLKLFMTHPGKNLNRDEIMDSLKGVDWEAYQRGVDVAVSRLRQKLGDSAKEPKFLKTVWGEGYCFIHPIEDIV